MGNTLFKSMREFLFYFIVRCIRRGSGVRQCSILYIANLVPLAIPSPILLLRSQTLTVWNVVRVELCETTPGPTCEEGNCTQDRVGLANVIITNPLQRNGYPVEVHAEILGPGVKNFYIVPIWQVQKNYLSTTSFFWVVFFKFELPWETVNSSLVCSAYLVSYCLTSFLSTAWLF